MPDRRVAALLTQAGFPFRGTLRAAILCAVLAAVAAVGLLALSGRFLAGAALAGAGGIAAVQAFNYLLPSAAIRALAVTRTVGRYGERLLGHTAALLTLANLRPRLFERIARGQGGLSPDESGGELATRLGNDVDALEDSVIRRTARPAAWAAVGVAIVAAMTMGVAAVVVVAAGMVAMRLAATKMAGRMLPAPTAAAADALAQMKRDYADRAAPCADIAVYALGQRIAGAARQAADRHDEARMAIVRAESAIAAAQALLAAATVAGVMIVARGNAEIAALGVLAALAALDIWAGLSQADMQTPRVEQAIERLASVATLAEMDEPAPVTADTLQLGPALALERGARVRIEGASGAGKTRLVETLAGLRYDAPEALAIDGVAVSSLPARSRRAAFALAQQDAPLIAGSVADNLRLAAPGISVAQMWDALRTACADDVVRALPDGLDQWLGGDGARLSGGQRRRIALARALLAGRPWLVLDEPSEGLDPLTEATLVERLHTWLDATGTGLLLISHRPAMAALAHKRFVLDQR